MPESVRRRSRRFLRSKWAVLAGIVAVAACLLFVFRGLWLLPFGDFLVYEDRLHRADVIHVIAGEDNRTDHAIQLYKRGLGDRLFFTGGWCENHGYNHGEYGKARAIAQGVPQAAIAFDDSSVISTYMEAEKLRDWIARSATPVRSVIVVSDPFHMRRARWAFKRVLGERIEVQMSPVPFSQTPYHRQWWKDPLSRIYVREEYGKLFYYVLRYQISSGKFRDWLASKDKK
ncbi:MAG: hypothetical protein C3F08_07675 [Candidatus Methylomirabilota bacterium]|nr:MAG: hypothetical protein C3F08_07675 [candidate division NC10 bacterium]